MTTRGGSAGGLVGGAVYEALRSSNAAPDQRSLRRDRDAAFAGLAAQWPSAMPMVGIFARSSCAE